MRFYILLFFLLVPLSYFSNCDLSQKRPHSRTTHPQLFSKISVNTVWASLKTERENVIELSETKISIKERITNSQFLDSVNGWVGGYKHLYKTNDSGKTWKDLSIDVQPNSYISSFFFTNQEQGWVVLVTKEDVDRYGLGCFSRIITTNDGGQHWTEKAIYNDEVEITQIKFTNSNVGWAIGNKRIARKNVYAELFAISTDDGGNTWNNLSSNINNVNRNEYGIANDSCRDIYLSSQIFLLTQGRKVIISSDRGKTWKAQIDIPTEEMWATFHKIGADNIGNLKIIGMSENSFGVLAIEKTSNTWSNYKLNNIPFFDALFLSNEEIIASGSEISISETNVLSKVGIILHSVDGGITWSVIYRSKLSQVFVSLTKVDHNQFYAVGDSGTFLQFSLPDKNNQVYQKH